MCAGYLAMMNSRRKNSPSYMDAVAQLAER